MQRAAPCYTRKDFVVPMSYKIYDFLKQIDENFSLSGKKFPKVIAIGLLRTDRPEAVFAIFLHRFIMMVK